MKVPGINTNIAAAVAAATADGYAAAYAYVYYAAVAVGLVGLIGKFGISKSLLLSAELTFTSMG